MLLSYRCRVGLGKRNTKMGIVHTKQQALLLVGASGGVGAALVEYLSSRTNLVCIPTYNRNKPSENHSSWLHYNSDDPKSTRAMFERISIQYDISLVIDTSGTFFASKLLTSNSEDISKVITTNLIAPIELAKNAQEFMQNGGKIIFMSSVVTTMQLIGSSIYAASKAGLERAVASLSPEFSQTGHAICVIRLGYMDYGMTYKINDKVRDEILDSLPGKEFVNIRVLGDLIMKIIESKNDDVNGILYEVK